MACGPVSREAVMAKKTTLIIGTEKFIADDYPSLLSLQRKLQRIIAFEKELLRLKGELPGDPLNLESEGISFEKLHAYATWRGRPRADAVRLWNALLNGLHDRIGMLGGANSIPFDVVMDYSENQFLNMPNFGQKTLSFLRYYLRDVAGRELSAT
jgi:hypothetical protein